MGNGSREYVTRMKKESDKGLRLAKIASEDKDEELTPLEYDISIYPADYTLEVIYQKWKNGDIVIPKFQRAFVWSLKQSSRLIESFMMGLPIPPVFFYIQADQKYLVLDGRQRLESVFYFFDGVFGPPTGSNRYRIFKLDGINPESRWYGKTFANFDESDKRKLKNSVLRAILVRQLHPNEDDTSVYHIFERLNTGGVPLQDQEVRNCVYAGKFNDLLQELNEYPGWRKVIGSKKPDSRQKDVQLVLRCIALYHNIDSYRKPMTDFLSRFMARNRDPDDNFIQGERSRFKRTCDILIAQFGERPFNPKGALNTAVLDAIFVAFMRNHKSCPVDIRNRFHSLMASPDFLNSTRQATTDTDTVHSRLAVAEKMLFE
jgi:hypothetical protein